MIQNIYTLKNSSEWNTNLKMLVERAPEDMCVDLSLRNISVKSMESEIRMTWIWIWIWILLFTACLCAITQPLWTSVSSSCLWWFYLIFKNIIVPISKGNCEDGDKVYKAPGINLAFNTFPSPFQNELLDPACPLIKRGTGRSGTLEGKQTL